MVIIGPGTGCQGQWLFWEGDGAVGPGPEHRLAAYAPQGAAGCRATIPALRRGRSCGRAARRGLSLPNEPPSSAEASLTLREIADALLWRPAESNQTQSRVRRPAGAPIAAAGNL